MAVIIKVLMMRYVIIIIIFLGRITYMPVILHMLANFFMLLMFCLLDFIAEVVVTFLAEFIIQRKIKSLMMMMMMITNRIVKAALDTGNHQCCHYSTQRLSEPNNAHHWLLS